MNTITKIKLFNFKRFETYEYRARERRNIFVGDNEAGKSSILQAIDLVLCGSRSKVEAIGLESLFNKEVVTRFLQGDRAIEDLPSLRVELYLSDLRLAVLEGRNNSDDTVCSGMRLACEPMDEYGEEIVSALNEKDALFPYEYYQIRFTTFADHPYTQNRRFLKHVSIDSAAMGTEPTRRHYTSALYEANTALVQRHDHAHAYRQSKAEFSEKTLSKVNEATGRFKFEVKSDGKSSLTNDLMITDQGIPVSQMGSGTQCFVKAEFALQKAKGDDPIDVVLIEEPENHLSHLNMRKLISQIESATQTQIFMATHSDSVCSRLDLHNASIVSASSGVPVSLGDLPTETAGYFMKAPNNKVLEYILSQRVVLVEGDAEYILLEQIYQDIFGEKPEESGIHVIAVGGTSFKRYLDLSRLLKIKTAVIRDNDGDYAANCVDLYSGYEMEWVRVFSDENDQSRTTFEKCIYQDNRELCDDLFKAGRRTLTVEEYMLSNKSDAALKLLENAAGRMVCPDYIRQALEWIRE